MKVNLKKILLVWFILGMIYLSIEILWRGITHPVMLIVGGLCGLLVGSVNQIPKFYNSKIIIQSLIGAIIVLFVELIAGIILNIHLNLGIWDYSNLPFNILGQICIHYGLLWMLLMPFAIWIEDTLQWCIYWYFCYIYEDRKNKIIPIEPTIELYSLKDIYLDFVQLK